MGSSDRFSSTINNQQSLEIKRAFSDRRGEANAWFNLGLVLSKSDRKEEALAAFRNARELYASMGLRSDVQDCDDQIQELTEQASPGRRSKPNVFQRIWRWFRQWVRWVFR